MKVALIEPQNDEDVVVEVTNDSGQTVKVFIPQKVFAWAEKNNEFGLNLVTRGHYL